MQEGAENVAAAAAATATHPAANQHAGSRLGRDVAIAAVSLRQPTWMMKTRDTQPSGYC